MGPATHAAGKKTDGGLGFTPKCSGGGARFAMLAKGH